MRLWKGSEKFVSVAIIDTIMLCIYEPEIINPLKKVTETGGPPRRLNSFVINLLGIFDPLIIKPGKY
jgi:hypothetical protein